MATFKMDPNFERNVQRDLQKAMQQAVDQLHRQYAGKPLTMTKPAVKRALEKVGVKRTDPEVIKYAQMITDGTKIQSTTK